MTDKETGYTTQRTTVKSIEDVPSLLLRRPDSLWHSYSGSSLDVGAPSEVDQDRATRTRRKAKKKSQP